MTCLALFSGPVTTLPCASRTGWPFGVHLRDAGLAEVLAHHDVGRELRPLLRDLGVVHLEDDRPVRVADPAGALLVLDRAQCVLPWLGKPAQIFMGYLFPGPAGVGATHTQRDTGFPARADGANSVGRSPRPQFSSSDRRSHGLEARVTETCH